MATAGELRSGKTHKDENFPVASWVIEARHRPLIMAFYEFVRVADDISDHATLPAAEKLAQLDSLEADLLGHGDGQPEALTLRRALAERGMSPRHPCDVLTAFRMDVTKHRYANWDELIHYCEYSAMPVGRFVLDVHGEDHSTWAASDALCAALQIINHVQDCGKDYRDLDRVYVSTEALAAAGVPVEAIGAERASPGLLRCLHDMTVGTDRLLRASEPLASQVANTRLALEINVIQTYARQILGLLKSRDPLSERVHLGRWTMAGLGVAALVTGICRRATRKTASAGPVPHT
jgi:squalene synthase HpnC